MKVSIFLRTSVLLFLITLLLQACSRSGNSSIASSTSRSDFSAETRIETDELEVKPLMTSNVLKIENMNLDTGQLVFRLTSPDGQVQWVETFTAPASYKHIFELDVAPGIWKLDIELLEATGNYSVVWEASN